MAKPMVAIVGRPNVGKSMLFNKLAGKRLSIVEDTPGVTRDRLYADCDWNGREFTIVDTGGIEPRNDNEILQFMRGQAEIAIDNADVIVLVCDIRTGVTAADQDVANLLLRSKKPVVLAVNKADRVGPTDPDVYEFYNLGLGDPIAISAIHGLGVDEMLDACFEYFPDEVEEAEQEDVIKVAVIGKPNVGKSSLVNRILGEERVIVSNVAGTTRDVITGEITLGGMNVRFFDTAGLHDSGDQVERIGMERAEKALREADVVLLTLDASRPLTQEDRGLLARDYAGELLVLLNKSDLPQAVDAAEVRQLNPAAEVLTLSAVQGESLAPLKARLTAFAQGLEQSPLTQQRHLDAARRASAALREARASLENGAGLELAAVDLRQAMACLGEITGDQVEERLLDEVFGRFCVGK